MRTECFLNYLYPSALAACNVQSFRMRAVRNEVSNSLTPCRPSCCCVLLFATPLDNNVPHAVHLLP